MHPFHVHFTEPLSAAKDTSGAIAHQGLPVHIMKCILQVLVVPLLAGATGKADVKPLTYVSALMALAGVGLLVEKGGVIMPNSGDIWSFASAVFFGIQVCKYGA